MLHDRIGNRAFSYRVRQMNHNESLSNERRVAQIRQILQCLKCDHRHSMVVPIDGDGCVEFCPDCDRVLEYRPPRVWRVNPSMGKKVK
jgi:hypothetical protein